MLYSSKKMTLAVLFGSIFSLNSCKENEFLQPKESIKTNQTSSFETPGDFAAGGFNHTVFANKIEAKLDGVVPGYSYCIIKNGQVVVQKGKGSARYPVDVPSRSYSNNEIQDIGSVSKFMTALLAMKLLDRTGLPINTALENKVYLYMPSYFNASNDFKKVTFRHLLAHTSGIINNGSDIEDIESTVEDGINETTDANPLVSPKPYGQYDYQNINYVMLRYAIVYLAASKSKTIADDLTIGSNPVYYDKYNLNVKISTWFRKLLREEIFQPALIPDWNLIDFKSWGIADNQKVKYYNFVNSPVAGYDSGDHLIGAAGAGGLKMSARQIAQVVGAARAGLIIKPSLFTKMKTGDGFFNQIGFDEGITAVHGKYYHKNGSGAGNAILLDFDGEGVNVQLAITTNMTGTEVTSPQTWATLFDQSWQ
ncbi:MAG: serine hydrolase [Bacteroidota bacterium]